MFIISCCVVNCFFCMNCVCEVVLILRVTSCHHKHSELGRKRECNDLRGYCDSSGWKNIGLHVQKDAERVSHASPRERELRPQSG